MGKCLEHYLLVVCDNKECEDETSTECSVDIGDSESRSKAINEFIETALNGFEQEGWHIDNERSLCQECAINQGFTNPDDY